MSIQVGHEQATIEEAPLFAGETVDSLYEKVKGMNGSK